MASARIQDGGAFALSFPVTDTTLPDSLVGEFCPDIHGSHVLLKEKEWLLRIITVM